MYNLPRVYPTYHEKVRMFIEAAMTHARRQKKRDICCPCMDCQNKIAWRDDTTVQSHLIKRGFQKNYTVWTEHGEIEDTHEETGVGDDTYHNGDESDGDDHQDDSSDDDIDDFQFDDLLRHLESRVSETEKELHNMDILEKASKDLLYDESKVVIKRILSCVQCYSF